jgi:hypothetical protein
VPAEGIAGLEGAPGQRNDPASGRKADGRS